MVGNLYEVLDARGTVLASRMEFQMALAFIRGYSETFYNERLDLRIREMEHCCGCSESVEEYE